MSYWPLYGRYAGQTRHLHAVQFQTVVKTGDKRPEKLSSIPELDELSLQTILSAHYTAIKFITPTFLMC